MSGGRIGAERWVGVAYPAPIESSVIAAVKPETAGVGDFPDAPGIGGSTLRPAVRAEGETLAKQLQALERDLRTMRSAEMAERVGEFLESEAHHLGLRSLLQLDTRLRRGAPLLRSRLKEQWALAVRRAVAAESVTGLAGIEAVADLCKKLSIALPRDVLVERICQLDNGLEVALELARAPGKKTDPGWSLGLLGAAAFDAWVARGKIDFADLFAMAPSSHSERTTRDPPWPIDHARTSAGLWGLLDVDGADLRVVRQLAGTYSPPRQVHEALAKRLRALDTTTLRSLTSHANLGRLARAAFKERLPMLPLHELEGLREFAQRSCPWLSDWQNALVDAAAAEGLDALEQRVLGAGQRDIARYALATRLLAEHRRVGPDSVVALLRRVPGGHLMSTWLRQKAAPFVLEPRPGDSAAQLIDRLEVLADHRVLSTSPAATFTAACERVDWSDASLVQRLRQRVNHLTEREQFAEGYLSHDPVARAFELSGSIHAVDRATAAQRLRREFETMDFDSKCRLLSLYNVRCPGGSVELPIEALALELVAEVNDGEVADALGVVQEVCPPGVEREIILADLFRGRTVSADVLNRIDPRAGDTLTSTLALDVIAGLNPPRRRAGQGPQASLGTRLAVVCGHQQDSRFKGLRAKFNSLEPRVRKAVVEQVLSSKLSGILGSFGLRALEQPLQRHVYRHLLADPDTKALVPELKTLFSRLDGKVMSRILATLLTEPATDDAAVLLARILSSGGLVFVKAGQQMCEDPLVPERFRAPLEGLRDDNATMSHAQVWRRMPHALRAEVAELGPPCGAGSVKQCHPIAMVDGTERLAAVLYPTAAADMGSTLRAMESLPRARSLVRRLRPMLKRELDLNAEAQAFEALRQSRIGQDAGVSIPSVHGVYDGIVLVRHMSPGRTHAAIRRQRGLSADECRRLVELHALLVQAALAPAEAGPMVGSPASFVFTDPHQGNSADDGSRIGLFDPGQWESLNEAECTLFVKLLSMLAVDSLFPLMGKDVVRELVTLCRPDHSSVNVEVVLKEVLGEAMQETGASPGQRLLSLLHGASKRGVVIPDGYFGLGKMLHSIDAQWRDLGQASPVPGVVARLLATQVQAQPAS